MSGYKDHFDKRLAERAEAESREKAAEMQEAARAAQSLADGKAWLEKIVLPELQQAKTELEDNIRISVSDNARQTFRNVKFNEVTFTVNPINNGRFRSYVFAACTGESDNFWVEARRPSDEAFSSAYQVVEHSIMSGNFRKLTEKDFQKFLKERIDSVIKMST